ncbi:uncharacterized protein LY89DRAFT_756235 [Mollisia scopiformis]|uniref:Uncharacterized protein n=1 Tax=Mollisia scopiformis TaxID=149040 RepID=A0A194WYD4_MOLSC|nr:uncharacterized protein LY89DRAFT_756235 [Mollisia scopiformis]KUJ12978.1 hypothetical protein LY89DRAFT_756235 [Mollisia scopiformis]
MTITFEETEFQCSRTRPDIPYILYVGIDYLLLVLREVNEIHRSFPNMPDPPQRYKLQLTEFWASEFSKNYGSSPKFDDESVGFGMEENAVIAAALLTGSNIVAYWEFRALFKGENSYFLDVSENGKSTFVGMEMDLSKAAEAPVTDAQTKTGQLKSTIWVDKIGKRA